MGLAYFLQCCFIFALTHFSPPVLFLVYQLLSSALKTDIVEAAEEAKNARLSESDATSRRSSFVRRPVKRTLSGRSQVSMVCFLTLQSYNDIYFQFIIYCDIHVVDSIVLCMRPVFEHIILNLLFKDVWQFCFFIYLYTHMPTSWQITKLKKNYLI